MIIGNRRLVIFLTALLLTVFVALLLMSRIIIEQNGEITSLLRRVHNLEVVVNKDLEYKIEKRGCDPVTKAKDT
jgi:hypothetical protein